MSANARRVSSGLSHGWTRPALAYFTGWPDGFTN